MCIQAGGKCTSSLSHTHICTYKIRWKIPSICIWCDLCANKSKKNENWEKKNSRNVLMYFLFVYGGAMEHTAPVCHTKPARYSRYTKSEWAQLATYSSSSSSTTLIHIGHRSNSKRLTLAHANTEVFLTFVRRANVPCAFFFSLLFPQTIWKWYGMGKKGLRRITECSAAHVGNGHVYTCEP